MARGQTQFIGGGSEIPKIAKQKGNLKWTNPAALNLREKGRLGELYVARSLQKAGFSLLGQNVVFFGLTELDILCNRGGKLYAIEVKSTYTGRDDFILALMTGQKAVRLRQGARLFNEMYCRGAYELELWLAICYFNPSGRPEQVRFMPVS